MTVNIIETSGLGKRYGSTWALRRMLAGGPRRARDRAGRPERRRQDYAAEPGGRPGRTDRARDARGMPGGVCLDQPAPAAVIHHLTERVAVTQVTTFR